MCLPYTLVRDFAFSCYTLNAECLPLAPEQEQEKKDLKALQKAQQKEESDNKTKKAKELKDAKKEKDLKEAKELREAKKAKEEKELKEARQKKEAQELKEAPPLPYEAKKEKDAKKLKEAKPVEVVVWHSNLYCHNCQVLTCVLLAILDSILCTFVIHQQNTAKAVRHYGKSAKPASSTYLPRSLQEPMSQEPPKEPKRKMVPSQEDSSSRKVG